MAQVRLKAFQLALGACLLQASWGCAPGAFASPHVPAALARSNDFRQADELLERAEILDAKRRPSRLDALLDGARQAPMVCVGEQHDDARHHQIQHALLGRMAADDDDRGVKLALGMEMFRRTAQPALNAYFGGEIDADELARVTNWKESWGFDFAMYRPMLETARALRVRIIGLNAPRALTRAVARRGLLSLDEPVRDSLPELVLDDVDHRRFFWAIMGFGDATDHAPGHEGHGHGHKSAMSPDNFYAAQVIWDETMAESASAWLSDPEPRQILVIAGNGHCHTSAVPRRVARRQGTPSLSVLVRSDADDLPAHANGDFVVGLR